MWFSNLKLLIVSTVLSFRPRMLLMILHASGSPHSLSSLLAIRFRRPRSFICLVVNTLFPEGHLLARADSRPFYRL